MDPAWIALIGTLCGGIGLKVVEHWLGKNKIKIDEAARLRDELRTELAEARKENKEREAELETLRRDYYDLRDSYAKLNTLYAIALDKLGEEAKTIDSPVKP